MSVLPRPTTSPITTPPRLLRWCAAILTAAFWNSKSLLPKSLGNAELRKSGACFLGKVVGHLDVDMVRGIGSSRAQLLVDDLDEFLGDVDAKPVVPSILEPSGELVAGVMVKDIDVELALL